MDLKHFLVFLVLCGSINSSSLPRVINRCRADTNFDSCFKQVLLDVRPYLARGDFGENVKFPALDPIYQPEINVVGQDLNFKLTDLYVRGAGAYDILTIKTDLQKLVFDVSFVIPQLTYAGKYSAAQKFPGLQIDLRGEGDVNGVLNKVHGRVRTRLQIVGDQVKMQKFQYKMKIDDGSFKVTSLRTFDGQGSPAVLLEILNSFLNADPSIVLRRIEPSIEKNFQGLFKQIAEGLFRDVKVSEFFAA